MKLVLNSSRLHRIEQINLKYSNHVLPVAYFHPPLVTLLRLLLKPPLQFTSPPLPALLPSLLPA